MKFFIKLLALTIIFFCSAKISYSDELRKFILEQLESEVFLSDYYIDEYVFFDLNDDGYITYNKDDIREMFNDSELKDMEYKINYLNIISRSQIDDFVTATVEYGFTAMGTNFVAKTVGVFLKTKTSYISIFDAQKVILIELSEV